MVLIEADSLAGAYKEIAETISVEMAVAMYEHFKGQQLSMPQHLYCKEYVHSFVRDNYDGHNLRQLSRMFDYSDRHILQILREERKKNT